MKYPTETPQPSSGKMFISLLSKCLKESIRVDGIQLARERDTLGITFLFHFHLFISPHPTPLSRISTRFAFTRYPIGTHSSLMRKMQLFAP